MTVEIALLHALSRGESVAVYDSMGRLMGLYDPHETLTRIHLRAMEASDPALVFESGVRREAASVGG